MLLSEHHLNPDSTSLAGVKLFFKSLIAPDLFFDYIIPVCNLGPYSIRGTDTSSSVLLLLLSRSEPPACISSNFTRIFFLEYEQGTSR